MRRNQGCHPWDGGDWEGQPVQRPRSPAQSGWFDPQRVWFTEDSGHCDAGGCGGAGAAERAREERGLGGKQTSLLQGYLLARGIEKQESGCASRP